MPNFSSPSSHFANSTISSDVISIPAGTAPSKDNTARISAAFARANARSTPNSSIWSDVLRNPAVSNKVTANPSKSIRTSMISRVVPATSDVNAASRPANAFSKVDFPTLGFPTIATSKPALTRSAIATPPASRINAARVTFTRLRTSGVTSTGTSSSAKSIVASSNAQARTRSNRHCAARWPNSPDNTLNA